VVTPFGCPEAINADGDQSVDRRQSCSIVDHDPETTQSAPERPVPNQNVHRVQRHWNDTDDEVGDSLVDDEDDEVGAQLLVVFVREENKEVGHGADAGKDEEKRGDNDHGDGDVTA